MKKCSFIIGCIAGLFLFSCSDDKEVNGVPVPVEAEATASSLVLKLSNEAVSSRAIDDLQGDRTQNILQVNGNVNIFFFTATGRLVKSDTPAATLLASTGKTYTNEDDGITTAVTEVVIVGNVGNITGSVTNKSSLHAIINNLEAAQTDYLKSTPDIWVYGATTNINWDAQPAVDGVKQGQCTIDLAPIFSRIDVTVNAKGITDGYDPSDVPGSNVDFQGVAVLYSGGYTHYTPNFIPTMQELTSGIGAGVKPMRSGIIDTDFDLWTNGSSQSSLFTPATGDESILNGTWLGEWNGLDNFVATDWEYTRSFYAFPPSDQSGYYNRNAIVTVYGDYHSNPGDATNDEVTPLFWPVHFSSTQILGGNTFAQPLQNGNVYKLQINLKGDYSEGGPGTTDPENNAPADLEVFINQVKWKAVIPMSIDFGD